MFIDEAKVEVQAGSGGDGCSSIYRDKFNRKGRPDGGPGGDGGDVVFLADENIQTLLDFQYRRHLRAERGTHGSSNHKKGHRGTDLVVRVPPGTIIKNADTGLILRDLAKAGDSLIVAKGGAGGRGNSRYREALAGAPGETLEIILELKLIADVGIVGYPNAGKSTLISRISSVRPKIAEYPFTTKEPVLGVVKVYDDAVFVVADIPGLIEDAHKGKGLGHKFLRHIERTKMLVHLVDIAAVDGRDPYSDYVKLNKELKLYSAHLAGLPQVIVLNKIDCDAAAANVKAFRKRIGRKNIFIISAATGKGLKELLEELCKKIKRLKRDEED